MDNDIGWKFPLTDGGASDGFNDSGMAHFKGDRIASLARETIQNSLDARKDHEQPVHVSFKLIQLKDGSAFGKQKLISIVEKCKESENCGKDERAELESALEILNNSSVNCLRVSDRNTTGLHITKKKKDLWQELVKKRGSSVKDNQGAGGSHGIGKFAPFTVTPLRTVFYWTHYVENGSSVEKFQGKAVLMSHDSRDGETQGTGFYGIKAGCKELTGNKIPSDFRLLGQDGKPVEGTALNILGFPAKSKWRLRIAESVIANYFYAIDKGKLEASIEPDEELEARGLCEINAETINKWLDFLKENASDDDDIKAIEDARVFRAVVEGKPVEKQDKDLGHCRLWIKTGDELPRKVGFVRGTGMLITTKQKLLERFPRYSGFAALCSFESPEGNELLRKMENPQHDQFEFDRLPNDLKDLGDKALKRITKWIREEIKKLAGPPVANERTVIDDLAILFPYDLSNDSFDSEDIDSPDQSKEPGFKNRVKIKRSPDPQPMPKRPRRPIPRPYKKTPLKIPISNVRILPIHGQTNCYRVHFTPEADGVARLLIQEAADIEPLPRDDIRVISGHPLSKMPLEKGRQVVIEITADEPIDGRAWVLDAREIEEKSS